MFLFFLMSILLIFTTMFYYNQFGGWIKDSWWKIIWVDIEAVIWSIFIFTYINIYNKKNFFLNKIGELSFSIYLVHSVVIYILVGKKLYIIFSSNAFLNSILNGLIVVLPITILISLLTYNYIEKPFLKMRVVYSEKLI